MDDSVSACLSQFDDATIASLREPVTIAQLKRHMDRRFDRLERTKADKADLRQFVTKRESLCFATKKDLRRFATKQDLRRFATKREMRLWAVDIKRHFDIVAESLEDKLRKVADGVADIAAIQLHVAHHSKALDDHETRITAIERKFVN